MNKDKKMRAARRMNRRMPAWMTLEKRSGDEYKYFRGTLRLKNVPSEAEVLFASMGHCACFINGKFVSASTGRYPGRVNRHQVASFLRPGLNAFALALGGSYFWKDEMEHRQARGLWASMAAFEFRAESGRKQIVMVSDKTWRCSPAAGPGWMTPEFDDSAWGRPDLARLVSADEHGRFWDSAPLFREYAATLPPAREAADGVAPVVGPGYALNVKESELPIAAPSAVVSVFDAQTDAPRFAVKPLEGAAPIPLDDSTPAIVLDFGRLVVGFLEIDFAAPASGRLRFEFDYSEDPRDFTKAAHFGPWIIEKLAVEAEFHNARSWFNARRRAFRYLRISLAAGAGPVRIARVAVRPDVYPAVNRGWFDCSDALLNEIWEVARYTLRVNLHQEYESCPRNEMLAFSGDVRIDGLCDAYAHGGKELMRSFFHLIQNPDAFGMVLDPLEEKALWDYPAWRIICLRDYWLYSGDAAVVKKFCESARLCAEWYLAGLDADGLIYQRAVLDNHHKPKAVEYTCSAHRLGRKAYLNALAAEALRCASELAALAGRRSDAIKFVDAAARMRRGINRRLWAEADGAYRDELYDHIPQDGNVLAALFGAADRHRAKSALAAVKDKLWSPYGSALFDRKEPRDGNAEGDRVISPLMCAYEAEARFALGQDEDALDLIRRCWGAMLRKGAKTFWEFAWNDAGTRWPVPAHAWSSGPVYLLPACVLGVRPLAPGFARALIRPMLGGLAQARGVVPAPGGLIGVSCEKGAGAALDCRVSLPAGVREAIVELPGCSRVRIDGPKGARINAASRVSDACGVCVRGEGEYRIAAE